MGGYVPQFISTGFNDVLGERIVHAQIFDARPPIKQSLLDFIRLETFKALDVAAHGCTTVVRPE